MKTGFRLTISEAARYLGVSPSTLRRWGQTGLIPKARRVNLNRVRVYTEGDIQKIKEFIRQNF